MTITATDERYKRALDDLICTLDGVNPQNCVEAGQVILLWSYGWPDQHDLLDRPFNRALFRALMAAQRVVGEE